MSNFPTGTVTFLFTDIEGSTQLAQAHPVEWEAARQRHHSILRAAADAHQGFVFQVVGDAFCVAFHNASDALATTLAAQSAIQSAFNNPESIIFRVRMGLHTGAAEFRDGDYHGYLALATVQRVMSVGHGGQVLLSQTGADLVRSELAGGIVLRDLGEHRLKDLARSEHLYQLVAPDLPADFPPLKTADHPHNLPRQLTSFIGRDQELARLVDLLPAVPLLTLTGSGGVGKTRLALELAGVVLTTFPDGVWFVELAPLADPVRIPNAIAAVVGVREEAHYPLLSALSDYFHGRTTLLLLDNCEHLISAAAEVIDRLLHAARQLKVVATSREALGIAGEHAFRVPSLSLPAAESGTLDTLSQVASIRLFVERCQSANSDFALTADNVPAVAKICRRLDGIPLAIELAAARVRVYSPAQIAARLDDRFRLLTGGSRTALPRQQTLRGAIDWSHSLLSEPERVLLRRLSVFAGGWTLEAAEAVCVDVVGTGLSPVGWAASSPASPEGPKDAPSLGGTALAPALGPALGLPVLQTDILDLLTHLVDKSLVSAELTDGESRYRMLETVRQYAREKLLGSREADSVRDRHLRYFMLLAQDSEPHLLSKYRNRRMTRLKPEHDNWRSALEWAAERDTDAGLSLLGTLRQYWSLSGFNGEGLEWYGRLLMMPNAAQLSADRAKALAGAGLIAFNVGLFQAAIAYDEQSIVLWRALGDKLNLARSLRQLGTVRMQTGIAVGFKDTLEECVALFREVDDQMELGLGLSYLGFATVLVDRDFERGRVLQHESIAVLRPVDDPYQLGLPYFYLGLLAVETGDYAAARMLLEESLRLRRQGDAPYVLTVGLWRLADTVQLQKDYLYARELYQEALALSRSIEARRLAAENLLGLGQVAYATGAVESALSSFVQSLALHRELDYRFGVAQCLLAFARILSDRNKSESAARLYGAADALLDAGFLFPFARIDRERTLALLHAKVDAAVLNAGIRAGRGLTIAQAADLALELINA